MTDPSRRHDSASARSDPRRRTRRLLLVYLLLLFASAAERRAAVVDRTGEAEPRAADPVAGLPPAGAMIADMLRHD